MSRIKETSDYLKILEDKGYSKYPDLRKLYDAWKQNLDSEDGLNFLKSTGGDEFNKIKLILGNAINNFRGTAFEEYVYDLLKKSIDDVGVKVELFWEENILIEEYYFFKKGKFEKCSIPKNIDLVIGIKDDKLIHPFIAISCKTWSSPGDLDGDKANFDSLRIRYPVVLGYHLCWYSSPKEERQISAQKTGMYVLNLSEENERHKFITSIREKLEEIKNNMS